MWNPFSNERGDSDAVQFYLLNLLRLTVVGAIILAAFDAQWVIVFFSALVLAATFVPRLIEEGTEAEFPIELVLSGSIFVYLTVFLGSAYNFYELFGWWDGFVHTLFGILGGLFGFLVLYIFYARHDLTISPLMVALFALAFAVMLGTFWEFFEYTLDSLFGTNLQHVPQTGVTDTMVDLIVASVGALFTVTLGYFYMKKRAYASGDSGLGVFAHVVDKTAEENPEA